LRSNTEDLEPGIDETASAGLADSENDTDTSSADGESTDTDYNRDGYTVRPRNATKAESLRSLRAWLLLDSAILRSSKHIRESDKFASFRKIRSSEPKR
jgi:hypothetical protein